MKNIFRFVPPKAGFLFVMFYLFTTTNLLYAQWIQTNGPSVDYVYALAVSPATDGTGGTNLFAGGLGVFLSTNEGTSWSEVNTGLTYIGVSALAVSATNLFAGTYGGVFLSTNNGTSWTAASTGLTDTNVYALAVSPNEAGGTNLFAGTYYGVFLSTNNGTSWTAASDGLMSIRVDALVVSPATDGTGGTNLFAGTYGSSLAPSSDFGGVFLSTDKGTKWTDVSTDLTTRVRALAVYGTNLFAGTERGGVFLSTNNGTSWTAVNTGLTYTYEGYSVYSLATSGTNLFAGTYYGVFLSTNNGTSWSKVDTGLTNTYVNVLAVSPNGAGGTNLFAGTNGSGVWRRPLSEMTSVERFSNDLPENFNLSQNYPNPFNPSTTIRYELPKTTNVKLTVYNMLGQIVSTLVNEQKPAGTYTVQFDGSGLTSGVYFYRLQSGTYSETKKIILMK